VGRADVYGFRRIDPYAKLFEDRIIFLGTPISDDVANAVMAQLLCLESMTPTATSASTSTRPVARSRRSRHLRHDALHQARRADRLPGQAASRGDPAGRPAPRQAAGAAQQPDPDPPALHRGHLRQTSDIEIQANEILRMRELLEKMISDHSGKDIEQVSRDIERDKILTAEGAVEYGLIDAVLESRKACRRSAERPTRPDDEEPATGFRVCTPQGCSTGYRRGVCDAGSPTRQDRRKHPWLESVTVATC
jgi:ATP-dependent Clp protease protease subunit